MLDIIIIQRKCCYMNNESEGFAISGMLINVEQSSMKIIKFRFAIDNLYIITSYVAAITQVLFNNDIALLMHSLHILCM